MEVSTADEVKHRRDEDARLKKLVAELSLDKDTRANGTDAYHQSKVTILQKAWATPAH
jgi:hypothetical protein